MAKDPARSVTASLPLSSGWWRSQYARAALFLTIGCASLLGAAAALSRTISDEMVVRLLDERMALARTSGAFLEELIEAEIERLLPRIRAAAPNGEIDDGSAEVLQDVLGLERHQGMFPAGLFVVDSELSVVAAVPSISPELLEGFQLGKLAEDASEGGIAVSRLVVGGPTPELLLLTSLNGTGVARSWFLGARLEPATTNLLESLAPFETSDATTLAVLDSTGVVVASSDLQALFTESDHGDVLVDAMADNRGLSGRCHRCHSTADLRVTRDTDVLAFAPLPTLDLGMLVRQPESMALAPAFALKVRMRRVGFAFMALFLLFAGLSVRSVVRPVTRLTRAVRKAETGNEPLIAGPFGGDEVGELAFALEQWRARMLESTALAEVQTVARQNQRQYIQRVLKAQEDERRRVARELHDTIAQDLAALRLAIERLGWHPEAPPAIRKRLAELEVQGHDTLQTVRRILLDLRLAELENMGFMPAVHSQVERVQRDTGIRCLVEVDGDEQQLSYDIAVTLLRILQESLQNIVLHAAADCVFVTVEFKPSAVTMTTEDDGKGFRSSVVGEPSTFPGSGLGMLGMEERAHLLGGTLTVNSSPGDGTSVTVTVPVSHVPGEST